MHSSHGHRADPAPAERQPWTILILLAVAQFMVILDVTVVNVALPSIADSLRFAPGDLQWVVTAYVLLTGGLMLLGGRASDLLGRRRVFLLGLLTFTAASLASGLAPSPGALVAARAAQGLGAAFLLPAALSTITATYEGAQRATALSVWGAIGAAGGAVGVLLGGMLTTWLGWRSVFLVNVPIGIVAAGLALRLVPAAAASGRRRDLDLPGALAAISGLVLFLYALDGTTSHGWGSARTLALFALAGGLLAAFVAIERAVGRPLVPPATWRVRSLTASAVVMLGATGVLVGAFFLNSLYLQQVLGASALETGLAFLPFALVIGLGAHAGSHLLARAGARGVVIVGLGLMVAAWLLFAAAPDHASYPTQLLPGFLLLGIGAGLTFVAVSVTAMADVRSEDAGRASGIMTTAHEVGAALGIAILSAVATSAGSGPAAGYADGALAAALLGALVLLVALAAVPATRPQASVHAGLH
jgi:EmrB/QacA subfamily drug resistance transporter